MNIIKRYFSKFCPYAIWNFLFAILTLRYFNVRYFDPFDIVADKHFSYSLFLISAI